MTATPADPVAAALAKALYQLEQLRLEVISRYADPTKRPPNAAAALQDLERALWALRAAE